MIKQRTLIIGDSGYIGSHIADSLGTSVEIVGLSRSRNKYANYSRIVGDITCDKIFCSIDFGHFDTILYCAGLSPLEGLNNPIIDHSNTVEVIGKIVERLKKNASKTKMLYFCSRYVYGNINQQKVTEQQMIRSAHTYGQYRYQVLQQIQKAKIKNNINLIALIIPGVYGWNNGSTIHKKGAINTLINQAILSRDITLFPTARYLRSLLNINDLVSAVKLIVGKDCFLSHPIYNIGGDETSSIETIATYLQKVFPAVNIRWSETPSHYLELEKGDFTLSSERFCKEFGWKAKHYIKEEVVKLLPPKNRQASYKLCK